MKRILQHAMLLLALGGMMSTQSVCAQQKTKPKKKKELALTIPRKHYKDSIDFTNAPKRLNNKYPLSDQKNKGKWKLLKSASDEFKGSKLNTKRWMPNNPRWKGRQPTQFLDENTTLRDGNLVMTVEKPDPSKLLKGYTHSAGFIVSQDTHLYGYFEARLKPINATWVSGFWMSNHQRDWWTEIDICENCPGVPRNRHDIGTNVHVFKSPKEHGDVKKHFSRPFKFYIPFELQKDYHVWGLEWTKESIRFYLDGVLFQEYENTHWHQPLHINVNNESNKWFGALPTDSQVGREYLVDYVRVWKNKATK